MSRNLFLFVAVLLAAPRPGWAGEALDQLKDQASSLGVSTDQAPQATVQGLPSLGGALRDICYDAGQLYYRNKPLLKLGQAFQKDFLDRFSKRCDLSQALFNFQQVGPTVYRSGRPTDAGLDQLKQKGVKTVLSLVPDYPYQGRTEAQRVGARGLAFANVPIDWTKWPTYAELDSALAVLTDPANGPVLIHCTCGYDRTGIIAAAYRVVVQGWPPARAAEEAKALGWHYPFCGDLPDFLAGYAKYRAK